MTDTARDCAPVSAALITGASSGIGAAAAIALARTGVCVALVARRAEQLHAICEEITRLGGRAMVVVADLSRPEDRVRALAEARAALGEIDILINNAGFGWYGYYSDMPAETARQMLAINVEAVMSLTHMVLSGMRSRRRGHIINVSSIAGHMPNQGIAMYSGSKAFVDAFTVSLHRELRGSGVSVSLVKPGAVRSGFWEAARNAPGGSRVPGEATAVSAEHVAAAIVSLVARPRAVVYVPGTLALTRWVEPCFGWFIDLLGPMLLKRRSSRPPA